MDRLSVVVVASALLAGACNDGAATAPASRRQRVNAVKAEAPKQVDPAGMCDKHFAGADAPTFAWPELTAAAPTGASGWRWINVWATWCKPCIEELPRLSKWRKRLAADGAPFELILVSADESDAVVTEFAGKHPGSPATLRLAKPDAVAEWVSQLGLTGASLPVHVFVDPAGKVRCIRASAVEDSDYPAVRALLSDG